jgi:hypothetical protein
MQPNEPRLADLDVLLEQATANVPDERPEMIDFAERLTHWLFGQVPRDQQVVAPVTDVSSPASVGEEIVSLLDASRPVALREALKRERRRFEGRLSSLLRERAHSPGNGDLSSFEQEVRPALEQYVATLMPLIEHRSETFSEQMKEITRIGNTDYAEGAYAPSWNDLAGWAAWWLGHVAGGFALAVENFPAVSAVFHSQIGQNLGTRTIPTMLTPEPVRALMESVGTFRGNAPPGSQYTHLVTALGESKFFRDAYPEFVLDPQFGAARWIYNLNFLASFWAAHRNEKVIGYWTTRHGAAYETARRLREDDTYRGTVAREVFDLTVDSFDSNLVLWVSRLGNEGKLLLLPLGVSHSEALAVLFGQE